jgi:hypothetical protein
MYFVNAYLVTSVKVCHHVLFGHWLEVVEINALALQDFASLRWNKAIVQLRGN